MINSQIDNARISQLYQLSCTLNLNVYLHNCPTVSHSCVLTVACLKDEAQTALFKDPVRTAQ